MIYRALLRPLLYALPAETAHHLAFGSLRAATAIPGVRAVLAACFAPRDPALEITALGLRFPSPIGLAAGFDKNAVGVDALGALGFGFVEAGTITGEAQPGNPRPRLFRLPADRALVNRMGFNNDGSDVVARRLARRKKGGVVLGINIGKTKVVAEDDAIADYVKSAERLARYADYLVVNVSSPNTPGLRNLQSVERLRPLLVGVRGAAPSVPLLVKIAPDLADDDVDAVADLAIELALDGIVATNTTISRDGLASSANDITACGVGGLSGEPLRARSLDVLARLRRRVGDRIVLVSVGGIATSKDVYDRLRIGASLVQIYSGFVYEGPLLAWRLARGAMELARKDGLTSLREAVGVDSPPYVRARVS